MALTPLLFYPKAQFAKQDSQNLDLAVALYLLTEKFPLTPTKVSISPGFMSLHRLGYFRQRMTTTKQRFKRQASSKKSPEITH